MELNCRRDVSNSNINSNIVTIFLFCYFCLFVVVFLSCCLSVVPDDDQLLAHRWERATSIETDIPAARPSIRSHSGTTYLTVPGAEDHGSSLSLHRRSIVDVRASMFKGSNAGSTMSSDDASHSGGEKPNYIQLFALVAP